MAKGPCNVLPPSLLCRKIWESRESHCPVSILPAMAWPGSAFTALGCPDRSSPLNKKTWLQIASKSYTKSKSILHHWGVQHCHRYSIQTVLRAGERPDLQNKLKSQRELEHNHGSSIIHYYTKPLISLCLSFAARISSMYF